MEIWKIFRYLESIWKFEKILNILRKKRLENSLEIFFLGGGIGNVEKIWGKLGNLKNIRKFFGEKIGYLGEKNWKFGEKKLEIILKFEKKIGNLEKILEN